MIVAFTNTKGGVGKSTLAVHLAAWLIEQGKSVALLDCDKQRSSSGWIWQVEPKVTIAIVETPENCVSEARGLARTHEFVIGDGPAGLDDISRALLLVSDLAILPITPSLLDVRSVQLAMATLRYAQEINQGRPEGRLVLNKMRTRDTISRELRNDIAPVLGIEVARHVIRDLQPFRDAVQQESVVTRMRRREGAAEDIDALFCELFPEIAAERRDSSNRKETMNG
jgi:chromosome partitioning protein